MKNIKTRIIYVLGLILLLIFSIYTIITIGGTIYLEDIDSGTTSPTGEYRWLDIANQLYSNNYKTSYNYTQAEVEVSFDDIGETFHGILVSENLKPNFAYQVKLVGYPGTIVNEQIGLVGRWWQEEWNGTNWVNGHNLNNKGNGSSPNPNDDLYYSRKNITEPSSPTGLKYKFTGYLVFDYFITDECGNATMQFEANSSYHVLWKTTQRTHTIDDGPIKNSTFDVNTSSPAYDIDYLEQTVKIFGEWERLPVGSVFLNPGCYNCQFIITEESFHGDGGVDAGIWAAAMGKNISFEIADVYVDDDAPPSWYDATHVKTIQEGVDNASSDNTVFVYNGTYYENVLIDKPIDLVGEDRNTTVIDGGGSGDVVHVTANWINITGFTIQNSGSSWEDAGIDVRTNFNTIFYNTISSNNEIGIFLLESSDNIISGNTIASNNVNGINLDTSSNNIIINNTISLNGDGICLVISCNGNTISNNKISNNNDKGIYLWSSNNNIIFHNYFINNLVNAWDSWPNNWDNYTTLWYNIALQEGNYWDDYTGTDANGDGIGDTPYPVPGGSNQDNYPLMNPYGSVKNLDTGEVFLTIQGAIDSSDTLSGHTIFVKNGTYYENVVVNKTINLIGESRDSTVIDGVGSGDVVNVTADWVNITSFTVKNCGYGPHYDAGIELYSNHCTISNNNITDNNDDGIHLWNSNNNSMFSNQISYNGDGIIISQSNYNIISNNTIFSNNNDGINLWDSNENIIINNKITQNIHNGILIEESINNSIINNNIELNQFRGIYLWFSNSNNIYHNNFIYNIQNAYDECNNTWCNLSFQEGNYWSNYAGTDSNGDGKGDTPYSIIGGINQDLYPLMNPITVPPTFVWVDDDNHGSYDWDVNMDWIIGTDDTNLVVAVYGSTGPPGWIREDVNNDGVIDINDITAVTGHYGEIYCPNYNKIQDGIDAVAGNGIVFVYNGTYYENVVVDKTIDLIGEDKNTTIIEGDINYDAIEINVSYVNITKFMIIGGTHGIDLNSNHSEISNNILKDSEYATIEINGNFNVISENNVSGNISNTDGHGIELRHSYGTSQNNTVRNNSIKDCYYGIDIVEHYGNSPCSNNEIFGNLITNCLIGVYINGDNNLNLLYHNDFISNNQNAYDECNNTWKNGYPSGGNYWDDHTGTDYYHGPDQDLPNADGIGDTSYLISGGGNQDNYPLMYPWGSTGSIVKINSTNYSVNPGVNFSIDVNCTPSQLIRGFQFNLSFNSNLLFANNVINLGEIFTSQGFAVYSNYTIENTRGNITNVYAVILGMDNVSTPGRLATIEFTSLQSFGISLIDLYNVKIVNLTDYLDVIVYDSAIIVIDTIPPEITSVHRYISTPLDTNPLYGWVNITCNVSDNYELKEVYMHIKKPDSTYNNVLMIKKDINIFYYNSSTLFSQIGNYTYCIWANDTQDNINISTNFNFSMPPNYDINMDGLNDIMDINLVALIFGSIVDPPGSIREDIDNDGYIDIMDINIVALHFGETWI